MVKRLDPSYLANQLRVLLIGQGPLSAQEAYPHLRVSQASFSRLVDQMGDQLIRIGKARTTRYALRRNIQFVGDRVPLFLVSEEGKTMHLGDLNAIEPRGFAFQSKQSGIQDAMFPDIPYFLEDLRPSGFIGRLIPRIHPELEAPENILHWSTDDCFRYWTKFGWNLVGNLLIGQKALELFLQHQRAQFEGDTSRQAKRSYPDRANNILLEGDAGSSAGGEQPKFMVEGDDGKKAVLVKFSPPLENPISQRVADLLVCESFVHKLLPKHGMAAPRSRVILQKNQAFLEVERFDRVGAFGRRGLLSLRSLGLEFVGSHQSWGSIASGLHQAKMISVEVRTKIRKLELFGELIGNTDMHPGNLSFFTDLNLRITELAPVYDMLPMAYSPRQVQIIDWPFEPKLPIPQEAETWKEACEIALEFWNLAASSEDISQTFRKIAAGNEKILKARLDLVKRVL